MLKVNNCDFEEYVCFSLSKNIVYLDWAYNEG